MTYWVMAFPTVGLRPWFRWRRDSRIRMKNHLLSQFSLRMICFGGRGVDGHEALLKGTYVAF